MSASGSMPQPEESPVARLWLGLSLLVLVFAGLFALAVVVARTPPFDRLVTDPLFFKRCLAAHVNLALVAWFYSFLAGLLFLLPGRERPGWLARHSVHIAGTGIALLLVGASMPGGRPVLANYIPSIDHPLFRTGQFLFGLGVLTSLFDRRLFWARDAVSGPLQLSDACIAGLRVAALGLLLALLTFGLSALSLPAGLDPDARWDLLVWGGGHVLQLVCVIAMLSVWLLLLTPVLGRPPVSGRGATWIFGAMLMPWTLGLLFLLQGTGSPAYRTGFTSLMQWGIFPPVLVFLALCGRALVLAVREQRIGRRAFGDLRISAFLVSAALTLVGFALGASIRGSNTMVPAHYHASVGAVTVAFMAAAYPILACFGLALPTARMRKAAAWQPLLYGGGMLVFAAGFALAGAYGMGRKVYGAEQAARGLAESVGLGLMGFGGLIAIVGGMLFLVVVANAWWRGIESDEPITLHLGRRWRFGNEEHG
ncbi:MAG: hypothetical protein GY725_26315 [bacterium]|nr:hypothetical protein [bacterium]